MDIGEGMEMELGFDDNFSEGEEDDDMECDTFDEGICGICMEVVIDRGVLDCCEHWFCFTCIDNWAGITNRCPLCKHEFQCITCHPVYDSSMQTEESSPSRNAEDWHVYEENKTLSFPSCYISDDAILCMDGVGCKIRNGLLNSDGDLSFDTSIACDSCDIWYHATCVGFNPVGTYEESWFCPRCMLVEVQDLPEAILEPSVDLSTVDGPDCHPITTDSFLGKVTVSVADDGETALVVSLVGEMDKTSNDSVLDKKIRQDNSLVVAAHDDGPVFSDLSDQSSQILPPLMNTRRNSVDFSPVHHWVGSTSFDEDDIVKDFKLEQSGHTAFASYFQLDNGFETPEGDENKNNECSEKKSEVGPLHRISITSSTAGDKSDCSANKDIANHASSMQMDYSAPDDVKPNICSAVFMNKATEGSSKILARTESAYSVKETKIDGIHQKSPQVSPPEASLLKPCPGAASQEYKFEYFPLGKSTGPDIMSFVREKNIKSRTNKVRAPLKYLKREDQHGIRVRKIIRRDTEENESSGLVHKLQEQIRKVVKDSNSRSSNSDDSVDEKLLAAFRATIAERQDSSTKVDQSIIRAKKVLMQKGTIRENLTKKIYTTSSGRRKRAWDRDWEVEFWKYRCVSTEKHKTLKSVLQLLKKSSGGSMETDQEQTAKSENSILSRIYLADTSVFPRKDDIRSLSEDKLPNDPSCMIVTVEKDTQNHKTNRFPSVIPVKPPATGKGNFKPQLSNEPHNDKLDKRKWALEILARKTTAAPKSANSLSEDNDALKGRYPLLAQLPINMRPELAAGHHNKVPAAVRQVQLYRITEHHLQRLKQPLVCRTADTELAIVDAVNIEKDIFERSNSKSVYINLCAQIVCRNRSGNGVTSSSNTTIIQRDVSLAAQLDPECCQGRDDNVEEALRRAGLSSDSPPSSPEMKDPNADNSFLTSRNDLQSNQPNMISCSKTEPGVPQDVMPSSFKSETSPMLREMESSASDVVENKKPDEADENTNVTKKTDLLGLSGEETCLISPQFGSCKELTQGSKEQSGTEKEPGTVLQVTNLTQIEADLCHMTTAPETNKNVPSNRSSTESVSSVMEHPLNHKSLEVSGKLMSEEMEKLASSHPSDSKSDSSNTVFRKVEAYVKEHIRPLCKSGVITTEQYKWAVCKTTVKVMRYHQKETNANFLIKEGDKVKKLALQYVEAAHKVEAS